jgi:hypothetical protein
MTLHATPLSTNWCSPCLHQHQLLHLLASLNDLLLMSMQEHASAAHISICCSLLHTHTLTRFLHVTLFNTLPAPNMLPAYVCVCAAEHLAMQRSMQERASAAQQEQETVGALIRKRLCQRGTLQAICSTVWGGGMQRMYSQ